MNGFSQVDGTADTLNLLGPWVTEPAGPAPSTDLMTVVDTARVRKPTWQDAVDAAFTDTAAGQ